MKVEVNNFTLVRVSSQCVMTIRDPEGNKVVRGLNVLDLAGLIGALNLILTEIENGKET